MRDLLPRHWRELNKRGQLLVIFGVVWIAIGVNVHIEPDPVGWENIWLFREIPREVRAGAWVVTGLIAIVYAFRPRRIENDGVGFLALYIMPAERAAGLLYGWLDYVLPFGGPGYSRGLLGGLVYIVIVAAVMVIAHWPNPPLQKYPGDDR